MSLLYGSLRVDNVEGSSEGFKLLVGSGDWRCEAPHFEISDMHAIPISHATYRGTSIIRNSAPLGPYERNMTKALWRLDGGGAASCERGTPVTTRRTNQDGSLRVDNVEGGSEGFKLLVGSGDRGRDSSPFNTSDMHSIHVSHSNESGRGPLTN